MAYIAEQKQQPLQGTSNTITVPLLAGINWDLQLIVIVCHDTPITAVTGTNLTWTKQIWTVSSKFVYVYTAPVGVSTDTSVAFTTTAATTENTVSQYIIKWYDSTTPIVTPVHSQVISSRSPTSPTITTSIDDALIMTIAVWSNFNHIRQPETLVNKGFISITWHTFLNVSYNYLRSFGTSSAQTFYWATETAINFEMITLAINDDGTGAIGGYIDSTLPTHKYIHLMDSSLANGILGESPGYDPTISNETITTLSHWTYTNNNTSAGIPWGINSPYEEDVLTWFIFTTAVTGDVNMGGSGITETYGITDNYDLSGEIITFSATTVLNIWMEDIEKISFTIGLWDKTNATFWQIGASNSRPSFAQPAPTIIDIDDASFIMDTKWTPVSTSIWSVLLGAEFLSAGIPVSLSAISIMRSGGFVGGSTNDPVSFNTVFEIMKRSNVHTIKKLEFLSDNQFFLAWHIQIWWTEDVYWDSSNQAVEFPWAYDEWERQINFKIGAWKLTLTVDATSGSTVILDSTSINFWNNHNFVLNSSKSIQSDALVIINANVTLTNNWWSALWGVTFISCTEIINSIDLWGWNIISSTIGTQALTITSQLDLDKLANCDFKDNIRAILISGNHTTLTIPAWLNFENNTVDLRYEWTTNLIIEVPNTSNLIQAWVQQWSSWTITVETIADITISNVISWDVYWVYNQTDSVLISSWTSTWTSINFTSVTPNGKTIICRVGRWWANTKDRFESSAIITLWEASFTANLIDDSFRLVNDTTALSYTGQSYNSSLLEHTVSSTNTPQKIYDYLKAWGNELSNLEFDVPISSSTWSDFLFDTNNDLIVTWASTIVQDITKDIQYQWTWALTVASWGLFEDENGAIWEDAWSIYFASKISHTIKEGVTPIVGVEVAYYDSSSNNRTYDSSRTLVDSLTTNGSWEISGYAVYKIDLTSYASQTLFVREYEYQDVDVPKTLTGAIITEDVLIIQDTFVDQTKVTASGYLWITIDASWNGTIIKDDDFGSNGVQKLYDYYKYHYTLPVNIGSTNTMSTSDGSAFLLDAILTIDALWANDGKVKSLTNTLTPNTLTLTNWWFFEDADWVQWELSASQYHARHVNNTFKDWVTAEEWVECWYFAGWVNYLYNTSLLNTIIASDVSWNVEWYVVYKVDITENLIQDLRARQYGYDTIIIPKTLNWTPDTSNISIIQDSFITQLTEATVTSWTGIAIDYTAKTITVTSWVWDIIWTSTQNIYDWVKYQDALSTNIDTTDTISTIDWNNITILSTWELIITWDGTLWNVFIQDESATLTVDTLTISADWSFEDSTWIQFEFAGSQYFWKHIRRNVKDIDTSTDQQDAVVSCFDTDNNIDVTYSTSFVNGWLITDISWNIEWYYIYKKDATTYTLSEYIWLYAFDWSIIPIASNWTAIGTVGSYSTIRLVTDVFVTLTKANALLVSWVTTTSWVDEVDFNSNTHSEVQDNLKARQTRVIDIEAGKSWYLSFYEEWLILSHDGTFFNLNTDWTAQNIADTTEILKSWTVQLGTAWDIDFNFNNLTIDYTAVSWTFDHRNEIMDWTITLVNSWWWSLTVQVNPTVSFINTWPNITIEASNSVTAVLNSIDSNWIPTNFTTGTRIQLYNNSGANASDWTATTAYSLWDKRVRTTWLGTESWAGLWMECTTAWTSWWIEPTWNTTVDGTTNDGTVIWITRALEIYNDTPWAVDFISVNYTYISDATIRFRIIAINWTTNAEWWKTGTFSMISTWGIGSVSQESNTIYLANWVDWSTVTEFTIDWANVEIDITDPDNITTVQRGYNWFEYFLSTEDGIRNLIDYFEATDENNYIFNWSLTVENKNVSALKITGWVIKRADWQSIVNDAGWSVIIEPLRVYNSWTVSWLTSSESTQLSKTLTTSKFIALK